MSNPTLTPRQKLEQRIDNLPPSSFLTLTLVTNSKGEVVEYAIREEAKAEARGLEVDSARTAC